jgi:hypothetical protein
LAAHTAQVLTAQVAAGAAKGVSAVVSVVVILVLAVGVASIVFATRAAVPTVEEVSKAFSGAGNAQANQQLAEAMKGVNEAIQNAQKQAGQVGAGTPTGVSLLTSAGVKEALGAYKKAIGGNALAAMRLTFHDTHSSIKAQSPKNPAHVDEYGYRSGVVSPPEPERLQGSAKAKLESFLFDPEKTALLRLDELKVTALGKMALEESKVTHVIVDRDRGKLEILIYISSPRDSGYVNFNEKGDVVRVVR